MATPANDPEVIKLARREIHNIARRHIDPDKLRNEDLLYLLGVYDNMFFMNDIYDTLSGYHDIIPRIIHRESNFLSRCDVRRKPKACKFELSISQPILDTVMKNNARGSATAAGIGCTDKLECLLLVFEHLLVHLVLSIYQEYFEKLPGVYEKYFECLARNTFGHTRYDNDLGLAMNKIGSTVESRNLGIVAPVPRKLPGYKNYSNSCYIDSILMIMFFSDTDFWKDNILDIDISSLEGKYTKNECIGSDIPYDKFIDLVKSVQRQLNVDKKYLEGNVKISKTTVKKCSLLRNLIVKCRTNMKVDNNWVMYNDASTYDFFTDIFPSAKLEVPYAMFYNFGGDLIDRLTITQGMILMRDYLEPPSSDDDTVIGIDWEGMNLPLLAFYNGGTPRVRKLNELGNETIVLRLDPDLPGTGDNIIRYKYTKIRKFGQRILNDAYKIIGVIQLHGVTKFGDGGRHYTSYFLRNNNWYYYDDMKGVAELVRGLPESVWVEENRIMPSMYFYARD